MAEPGRDRASAVYAIADLGLLGASRLPPAVVEMAETGVRWIQIRAKEAADADLYRLVEACCRRLEDSGAMLWVDDRADIAACLPVRGVHVGQRDLSPSAVRSVVGSQLWIGASTHDLSQVAAAAADPAVDVVAVGPVFPTTSKHDPDPVVGLELVRRARGATSKPLVAIGGIDADNLGSVLAAGADHVAVLGAVCRGDVGRNCRRLMAAAEACA